MRKYFHELVVRFEMSNKFHFKMRYVLHSRKTKTYYVILTVSYDKTVGPFCLQSIYIMFACN